MDLSSSNVKSEAIPGFLPLDAVTSFERALYYTVSITKILMLILCKNSLIKISSPQLKAHLTTISPFTLFTLCRMSRVEISFLSIIIGVCLAPVSWNQHDLDSIIPSCTIYKYIHIYSTSLGHHLATRDLFEVYHIGSAWEDIGGYPSMP